MSESQLSVPLKGTHIGLAACIPLQALQVISPRTPGTSISLSAPFLLHRRTRTDQGRQTFLLRSELAVLCPCRNARRRPLRPIRQHGSSRSCPPSHRISSSQTPLGDCFSSSASTSTSTAAYSATATTAHYFANILSRSLSDPTRRASDDSCSIHVSTRRKDSFIPQMGILLPWLFLFHTANVEWPRRSSHG